ncbi:biosynthetic-type acetolactate synthase large subunit [Halocalculus aciditolerans]|uniref:Acetolactate synthase n=1 Tax=Halocalculus aciditolerans TaxID=1383812 RepID=A0A830F985_9EURY|nr:biosynthetic-type acetolactate synthase large subunit [Halocalculus aciditolerans]GGL52107.1 acetolactate synthase [Halocalculus aciditolerans]
MSETESETRTAERAVQTGAEAAISALEDAGVEVGFGVQGGAIMPVYDALGQSDIRHVTMAHEQGAAHAADAYGIVTGEPGLCLATSGPGATNLVTGLADADMDSDPMVALTGQVPTDMVGNDAFQETDTTGVTTPITKTNYFATDAGTVGDTVRDAVAAASEGRQGPTLVDLPKDVTQAETATSPSHEPETKPTPEAPAEAVDEAARAFAAAEKPVILAGGGVIKGEATPELRQFAVDHGVPVVTTMPGVGAFDETHPLALGMAGMHGTGPANMALTHCDFMLAVGTRFDDRLTGGVETFAPAARIAHIDIDASEVSKNVHADYPLIGDASAVLHQLDSAVPRSPDAADWQAQCETWEREYPMDYDAPEDEPVKPQFVVEAVDEATAGDTVVTTGVGQHQMWAVQYWTFTEPRTWVSSHGLGTMGYGLPAAIGAKVAAPEREVVSFEGDGSFLMTCQELSVAVREELDITVFVLNNEAIGMVRQWQDAFFEGRRTASEYPWGPDFATVAEAFGAAGFTIDTYDDVADTVEAAREYDGPSVVDCRIDPREDVYPMVPSGGDNGAFALREEHL